jgi:DNA-binding PadR family transcriptional regulator
MNDYEQVEAAILGLLIATPEGMGWYRIGIKIPSIAPVNPDIGTVLRDLLRRGFVRSEAGADGREVFAVTTAGRAEFQRLRQEQ